MANYYIADTHFGHKAILNYDHRPFFDLKEMEEVIIMNWNATVRQSDTVYILGDFCWGKADDWLRIIRKLNGQKVLIKGNHDLNSYPEELKKEFVDITDYKEIVDNIRNESRKVILSHYPILFYKRVTIKNIICYAVMCTYPEKTLSWKSGLRNCEETIKLV